MSIEKKLRDYCSLKYLKVIIEVRSAEKRHLYDARTGEIFFTSNKERFANLVFEVSGGTAEEYNEHNYNETDLIIYDSYDMKNDLSCFIYYNGEKTTEFVFEGEPYMIFDFRCYEGDPPLVKQLAVKQGDKFVVLDDKCTPIANLNDSKIIIQNQLKCKGYDGMNSDIVCQSTKVAL